MSLLIKRFFPTTSTPEVLLDPEGTIIIKGRLTHFNLGEFYKELGNWIDEYMRDPAELTSIDIHLEYLNTTNCITIIGTLKKFLPVKLKDKKLIINWHYEEGDDDIIEQGEFISSSLNIRFNFIRTPEVILEQR
jgi:hypothetical protein